MIFFTDENISDRLAAILDIFDRKNQICAHKDSFEKGVSDIEWLKKVSSWEEKPVVLCGDIRILKNKAERQVLKECDLMFVYLAGAWMKLGWNEQVWKATKAWPAITKAVGRVRYPSVFEVSINGKVGMVSPINKL